MQVLPSYSTFWWLKLHYYTQSEYRLYSRLDSKHQAIYYHQEASSSTHSKTSKKKLLTKWLTNWRPKSTTDRILFIKKRMKDNRTTEITTSKRRNMCYQLIKLKDHVKFASWTSWISRAWCWGWCYSSSINLKIQNLAAELKPREKLICKVKNW